MKKNLLKTAMVVGAMLLGMNLQAQIQSLQISQGSCPTSQTDPNVIILSSFQQEQMQFDKPAMKAGAQTCTLTLNLEYDATVFNAPFYSVITNDNEVAGRAMSSGNNVHSGAVPPGTYNIITKFSTKDNSAQYFVIKENVEVTGDMTLTLNPAEATNHIATKIYGPDGDQLKVGLKHYDAETATWIVDEPSDYSYCLVADYLYQKGISDGIDAALVQFQGEQTTEENSNCQVDFYVTDVSDRFVLVQTKIAFSPDYSKSCCARVSTDDLKTCVLENNPNDYVQQAYNYKYTPYGRDHHEDGLSIATTIWEIGEKPGYIGIVLSKKMENEGDSFLHESWIDCPDVDPCFPGVNFLVQTRLHDYGEIQTVSIGPMVFENFIPTGWTYTTPIQVKNGQKILVNFGHPEFDQSLNYNNLYGVIENNTFVNKLLPAPEAFTYPAEQALGDIGDNCPINALNITAYQYGNQLPTSLTNYFVGRYGEVRYCSAGTTTTLKFNGEEVDIDTFNPTEIGTLEFTVYNPNVEVDGLEGHNTTTVFFDQNQDDMTPPAVEMLHFKNSEGGVTDRFATADEGTMEFYASDFDYYFYPNFNAGVFECQPLEVLVEYAPYGTENWNELTVEEDPELFQEPGWGYFYRGSLAYVTGHGQKGWFDLRFRLKDASGNWMDQVVSPAFRIDDHAYTSVENIVSDNAREVARYNLAGQRIDGPCHGINIVKMSDGTARKVLVK